MRMSYALYEDRVMPDGASPFGLAISGQETRGLVWPALGFPT